MNFDQISHFTGVSIDELVILNPSLKRNMIPADNHCYTLYLPVTAIGEYIANEDSIHLYMRGAPQTIDGKKVEEVVETYTVRSGDVLGLIAERNGVSVTSLREWNNISGNRIYPGQKLSIYKTKTSPATTAKADNEPEEKKEPVGTESVDTKTDHLVHTIQSGDTLWDIAKKYPGISVNDIKKANSGLNYDRLKPGQKIKIPNT
jgi:membrane-bound lytic murein transglycosylase D